MVNYLFVSGWLLLTFAITTGCWPDPPKKIEVSAECELASRHIAIPKSSHPCIGAWGWFSNGLVLNLHPKSLTKPLKGYHPKRNTGLPTILLQGQNLLNFRNVKLYSFLILNIGYFGILVQKSVLTKSLVPDNQNSQQLFPPKTKNWVFPKIGVPPKHPKMIIFSRKTHGCWGNPPFMETSNWNLANLLVNDQVAPASPVATGFLPTPHVVWSPVR